MFAAKNETMRLFSKKNIRVRKRGLFLFCIIIGLWQHHPVMDVWHALLIDNP